MSAAAFGLPAVSLVLGLAAGPRPARLGAEQLNLLADRLSHAESYKVRIQAALILGAGGGEQADPVLRQALRDDTSAPVRAAAALALADLDGSNALSPLVDALADDDAFVRAEAAKALSQIAAREGPALAAPLSAALGAAPEVARPPLLHLLGGLGDAGCAGLVAMLGDPAGPVQSAVRTELAALPAAAGNRALELALANGTFAIRAAAAGLLGERKDAAALPLLADAATDPTEIPEVQAAAHQAIEALRDSIDAQGEARRAVQAARPAERVRALVLLTAKAGRGAEPTCEAALRDGSELVRGQAVAALAELGDPQALPALRTLLGREKDAPLDGVIRSAIHRLERSAAAGPSPAR